MEGPNNTIYCCDVTNTIESLGNNDIWRQKKDGRMPN